MVSNTILNEFCCMFSKHINLNVNVNVTADFIYIYLNSVELWLYNHFHVKVFFSINFKLYITLKNYHFFRALIFHV